MIKIKRTPFPVEARDELNGSIFSEEPLSSLVGIPGTTVSRIISEISDINLFDKCFHGRSDLNHRVSVWSSYVCAAIHNHRDNPIVRVDENVLRLLSNSDYHPDIPASLMRLPFEGGAYFDFTDVCNNILGVNIERYEIDGIFVFESTNFSSREIESHKRNFSAACLRTLNFIFVCRENGNLYNWAVSLNITNENQSLSDLVFSGIADPLQLVFNSYLEDFPRFLRASDVDMSNIKNAQEIGKGAVEPSNIPEDSYVVLGDEKTEHLLLCHQQCADVIIKLLLYIASKSARLNYVKDRSSLLYSARNKRSSKKKRKTVARAKKAWDYISISSIQGNKSSTIFESKGKVSPHYRRGHFRMQVCGPKNTQRKVKYIEPTFVAIAGDSPEKKNYTVQI